MDLTYDPKTSKLSDGREVVQFANAMIPHPHPMHKGKLVETKSVIHLHILDPDNTTDFIDMYACNYDPDKPCFKVFNNPRSVSGHMPSHVAKVMQHYTDDQLRTIVKECKKAIAEGHRNFAEIAANELNKLGMVNLRGNPMTSNLVSHLYVENKSKFRYHKPRTTERRDVKNIDTDHPFGQDKVPAKVTTNTPHWSHKNNVTQLLDDLQSRLGDASHILNVIAIEVKALAEQVDKFGTVNNEIREKAEKYDQMKNLLGHD